MILNVNLLLSDLISFLTIEMFVEVFGEKLNMLKLSCVIMWDTVSQGFMDLLWSVTALQVVHRRFKKVYIYIYISYILIDLFKMIVFRLQKAQSVCLHVTSLQLSFSSQLISYMLSKPQTWFL